MSEKDRNDSGNPSFLGCLNRFDYDALRLGQCSAETVQGGSFPACRLHVFTVKSCLGRELYLQAFTDMAHCRMFFLPPPQKQVFLLFEILTKREKDGEMCFN